MRNKWNNKNINEFGLNCLDDLFTFEELAKKTVEPNYRHKKGNKNALDQKKIDLIKSKKKLIL